MADDRAKRLTELRDEIGALPTPERRIERMRELAAQGFPELYPEYSPREPTAAEQADRKRKEAEARKNMAVSNWRATGQVPTGADADLLRKEHGL